jgi:hypothetical protein
MKNTFSWDVTPLALVRADVSEERIVFIIRVKRVSKLGTLAVSHVPSSLTFPPWWWRLYVSS